ncbi:imidazole glycerol phosphate synthase subunit HisH [Sediminibacillus halophilus]|uniref:Imidazole glycerol phosphate synthase subunit HisH n=1 Tax=Sediminibacillus halophilus TaxID=482461 RepID=A0A1G9M7E2_9BACI|nr:imidazole glycerol phosphate synthase subunit HisH [Sediminibacillus halophilus]SDL70054.1 glutamine amidotransferase [Sediminibacillus halophilus]
MIAIIDYGMGNVASVSTALYKLGYEVTITDDREVLQEATHIVLPGVGSFQAAMEEIEKRGLKNLLREMAEEKPFLGICLGMQLLFDKGFEGGETEGLSILPGTIEKMETKHILPHIGWNALEAEGEGNPFSQYTGKHVYFVHSFAVQTNEAYIAATAEYGMTVPAIVKKGKVYGIQFHPEKSGEVGVDILKTFLQEAAR